MSSFLQSCFFLFVFQSLRIAVGTFSPASSSTIAIVSDDAASLVQQSLLHVDSQTWPFSTSMDTGLANAARRSEQLLIWARHLVDTPATALSSAVRDVTSVSTSKHGVSDTQPSLVLDVASNTSKVHDENTNAPRDATASARFGFDQASMIKSIGHINIISASRRRVGHAAEDPKVVFSLTTTHSRINEIEPVLTSIVRNQKRRPDVVNLAIPPDVEVPEWLSKYDSMADVTLDANRSCVFNILRMKEDYGPASKLLATLLEGGETSENVIVIYGDDDVIYGNEIVDMHVQSQQGAKNPTAFSTRVIGIPPDFNNSWVGAELLSHGVPEATGSISVRASWLPAAAFTVGHTPDICRLSDDLWLAHHFLRKNISFALLPNCTYNWQDNIWPDSCGIMHTMPEIGNRGALSSVVLDAADPIKKSASREGGDWRSQLARYKLCAQYISETHRD